MRLLASSRTKITRSLLVTALALLALAAPARAAFPGANGKIAYYENGDIYTINPDGTGRTNITNDRRADYLGAAWSPDGLKIAFSRLFGTTDDVWTMKGDGTGLTRLTSCNSYHPAWSPDANKIVFTSNCAASTDVFVMNADGANQLDLTSNSAASDSDPSWSPDGSKIAFESSRDNSAGEQIYTMNPDGSGQTRITDPLTAQFNVLPDWSPDGARLVFESGADSLLLDLYTIKADGSGQIKLNVAPALRLQPAPAWSPDGRKIVFAGCVRPPPGSDCFSNLYTINPDGSQLTQVTSTAAQFTPNWQAIPQSYARPKGATPLRASLVLTFKPCASSNSTHGSPLAFPSCKPPQQTSDWLTVGTPDANGETANSVGSVRYDAFSCPACVGPGPNADVRIAVSITDVRNKSDLSDYTGELRLNQALRITDKDNTPNPGGPGPATVSDTSFPTTVPCATTSDTTVGSTCSMMTSANTLVPNAVVAGERAIWQLGQVQVYDGGADGVASTTGDNTLFMDEGVFIP